MWVIETDSRYCKDCYKCLKYCPVKAIKFENGISRIVEERCILCGNCIKVCPQDAKKDISYLEHVKRLIRDGKTVVASIAPSFAAYFTQYTYKEIVYKLKKMGFSYVEETAIGAYFVAQAVKKEINNKDFTIGTACPSVVNLIEKYYPQYIPYLSRSVSPIISHAKNIKKTYGNDVSIVFISPCVAKKEEVMSDQIKGLIDYPISFRELEEWFNEVKDRGEANFDRDPAEYAPLFPIDGGIMKTAQIPDEYTSQSYLAISGEENIINFLDNYSKEKYPQLKFVDFLMCEGGCINGPLSWEKYNPLNKLKIVSYMEERSKEIKNPITEFDIDEILVREYKDRKPDLPIPSEEEIREILKRIGKYTKEDELNCGSCGYNSCRDKAIGVYQKMAEPEMCLPYMRQKAESLANLIIENTPNGVVIVNSVMKIISANPAFIRIFNLKDKDVTALSISEIINPQTFKDSYKNKSVIKKIIEDKDKIYEIITFPVIKENVVVGIIRDITQEIEREKEMEKIRKEIATKTHEVITKQMRVAQEIAGLLGETTAETKSLLLKLSKILMEDESAED